MSLIKMNDLICFTLKGLLIVLLLFLFCCAFPASAQQLQDPEGYTLVPTAKWTNGNIRGYSDATSMLL